MIMKLGYRPLHAKAYIAVKLTLNGVYAGVISSILNILSRVNYLSNHLLQSAS